MGFFDFFKKKTTTKVVSKAKAEINIVEDNIPKIENIINLNDIPKIENVINLNDIPKIENVINLNDIPKEVNNDNANNISKVNDIINAHNKSKEFENILQKAAAHPEFRDEFYKGILTEELIILTKDSELPVGSQKLEKDTRIRISTLTDGSIPVFTSLPKIYENGVVKEEISYMKIIGKDLFEMSKGAKLFLNPFSDFGKELLPGEVERILDGSIIKSMNETREIAKDTRIQLGVPAVYPTEITAEMSKEFTNINTVIAAYVAWIKVPNSAEPPHYIFALDVDGEYRDVAPKAGEIFKKYADKGSFADFIKIERSGGISEYFLKESTPFYQK